MDALKTKVILVGNSLFPNWGGEKKDIPNVEQNLDLLRKIFVDPKYFGIPNDPQHLIELKDESSQEILMKVKHETKSFLEKDLFERLIFYYCGHGIPGEDSKLFFASKDTVRRDYEISSVDSKRLFSYLEGFCAKELIIILDCCYAAQSKENQGDADTLIQKSLPDDKPEIDESETGIYYLFAAGRDNVAKFNPMEPKKPTYFTTALLSSIEKGTEPGRNFITIGEIYDQIRKEIAILKKTSNADIPDPRPVLHGDVRGFEFCINIKFKNQEDLDWEELLKDPSMKKLLLFKDSYQKTRFEKEMDQLSIRILDGQKKLKIMEQNNDATLAYGIKEDYKDIPYIYQRADNFLYKQLAANAVLEEKEIASASFEEPSLVKDSPSLMDYGSSAIGKIAETKSTDAGTSRNMYGNAVR